MQSDAPAMLNKLTVSRSNIRAVLMDLSDLGAPILLSEGFKSLALDFVFVSNFAKRLRIYGEQTSSNRYQLFFQQSP